VVGPLDLREAGSYGVAGPLWGQIAPGPQNLAEQDIRDTWSCPKNSSATGSCSASGVHRTARPQGLVRQQSQADNDVISAMIEG
jgi:hypothetical protein